MNLVYRELHLLSAIAVASQYCLPDIGSSASKVNASGYFCSVVQENFDSPGAAILMPSASIRNPQSQALFVLCFPEVVGRPLHPGFPSFLFFSIFLAPQTREHIKVSGKGCSLYDPFLEVLPDF